MNKKRGFTLVELLAIIVILSVILAIAIPKIYNVITNAKLLSYQNQESVLKKTTSLYVDSNNISLPIVVGESISIPYTDVRDAKNISTIVDLDSDEECLNSKVYIELLADKTYKYTPILICDNYISINNLDVAKGIGNFETDSNSDGLADGITNIISSTKSLSTDATYGTYSQKFVSSTTNSNTSQNRVGYPMPLSKLSINRKLYVRLAVKGDPISNISNIRIGARETLGAGNTLSDYVSSTISNNYFNYISGILTINSVTRTLNLSNFVLEMCFGLNNYTVSTTSYYDDIIVLDLTEMYGSGNELSSEEMDAIFEQSR